MKIFQKKFLCNSKNINNIIKFVDNISEIISLSEKEINYCKKTKNDSEKMWEYQGREISYKDFQTLIRSLIYFKHFIQKNNINSNDIKIEIKIIKNDISEERSSFEKTVKKYITPYAFWLSFIGNREYLKEFRKKIGSFIGWDNKINLGYVPMMPKKSHNELISVFNEDFGNLEYEYEPLVYTKKWGWINGCAGGTNFSLQLVDKSARNKNGYEIYFHNLCGMNEYIEKEKNNNSKKLLSIGNKIENFVNSYKF